MSGRCFPLRRRLGGRARRRGLQAEILTSLLVVLLTGLGIVAVVMGGLATRSVERAAIGRLQLSARQLERLAAAGPGGLADIAALATTFDPGGGGQRWLVLDAHGREVVPGRNRARVHPEASAWRSAASQGLVVGGGAFPVRDLVVARSFATRQGEQGLLVGAVPAAVLEAELRPLLRSGAWVLVSAAIVFVLFGSYLLRRRIVLRVQELSRASAQIARGDLQVRLEPSGGDELADLAGHFNEMAESLERQRNALIEAHRSLARGERLASVGRLAAGVAHEVGNPVAAILGYVDVSLRALRGRGADPVGPPERALDAIARIRSEALRVRSLVRELLDLARPREREVSACAPRALLEAAQDRVRHQPLFAGVAMDCLSEPDLPSVETDPERIEQLLVNLLQNAAQALSKTLEPRIDLRARAAWLHPGRRRDDLAAAAAQQRHVDAVALDVIDNGSGIDPDDLGRVFDPFFTTKQPGEGTGLGLWNAHRIAELLGGRIEAESRPGCTRFSLILPAADTSGAHDCPPDPDHR